MKLEWARGRHAVLRICSFIGIDYGRAGGCRHVLVLAGCGRIHLVCRQVFAIVVVRMVKEERLGGVELSALACVYATRPCLQHLTIRLSVPRRVHHIETLVHLESPVLFFYVASGSRRAVMFG